MRSSIHATSKLTPAERALRIKFSQGNCLDLNQLRSGDEDGVPANDARHRIRGAVLRDLLLSGASLAEGHGRELTVVGADIEGPLDLRFAKIDCPIRLESCRFDSTLMLSEAELRSVSLRNSTVQQTIDASHVRVTGDLMLDGLHVIGQLRLSGAHLEDDLHLTGATIGQAASERAEPRSLACQECTEVSDEITDDGDEEPTLLDLENIEVKGRILADALDVGGRFSMDGATVGGAIQLNNARLGHASEAFAGMRLGVAWSGDGIKVEGELKAKKLCVMGQVSLVDAQVQTLVMKDMHIQSTGRRPALLMDRLQCSGSIFCDEEDRDIKLLGGIKAIGIKVGATLYLGKGQIRAPQSADGKEERSVFLRRARISDDLSCSDGFQSFGIFDISSAQVGGSVDLRGAAVKPVRGGTISFDAGRAQIGGNLRCDEAFTCDGTMGLRNVKIDGWAAIHDSTDGNDALVASGLRVGRYADLRTKGRVDLSGAEVTGDLTIKGEDALVASGLRVGHHANVQTKGRVDLSGAEVAENLTVNLDSLIASGQEPAADLSALTARVLEIDGRQEGRLDLTRTSVGLLINEPASWCPDELVPHGIPIWLLKRVPCLKRSFDTQQQIAEKSPIVLDGLVYEDIADSPTGPKARIKRRIVWLEAGTKQVRSADNSDTLGPGASPRYRSPGFVPQPYQQLAAVYRRGGRDSDARDVLHAMHCRRNSIMHPLIHKGRHPILRVWNTTENWALGYGYRPVRAFVWIVVLAALSTAWFVLFDNQDHVGIIAAAILSLGFALPGSGLDKVEHFTAVSPIGHLFALGLVLAGLILGATVLAAIGRVIRNGS